MTSAGLSETMDFNSQPHKEADIQFPLISHLLFYFNSQPHKEADKSACLLVNPRAISTHSLTRRLTAREKGE